MAHARGSNRTHWVKTARGHGSPRVNQALRHEYCDWRGQKIGHVNKQHARRVLARCGPKLLVLPAQLIEAPGHIWHGLPELRAAHKRLSCHARENCCARPAWSTRTCLRFQAKARGGELSLGPQHRPCVEVGPDALCLPAHRKLSNMFQLDSSAPELNS